eukprot:7378369-Pyramimonas_sp.AAC.1
MRRLGDVQPPNSEVPSQKAFVSHKKRQCVARTMQSSHGSQMSTEEEEEPDENEELDEEDVEVEWLAPRSASRYEGDHP